MLTKLFNCTPPPKSLIVQKILKDNGISFQKHVSIKLSKSYHQADLIVESNKVIEIFGDYWHFNPNQYDGDSIHKVRGKKIKVKDLMTKKLITAKVGTSLTEAKKILFKNKIEKLIIVDNNFKCKGLVTVKDIQKSQIYPEAAKDKKGSLVVAAAIGTGPESFQRAEQLAEAGADVCTCPLSSILGLAKHPLTDIGLAKFLADHQKANS